LLTAFAFGGAGMALTTWMRSWQDFEYIQLATLPMFLFSGTFYPLSAYPPALRWFVEVTPLYQAVQVCRAVTTGDVGLRLAVPVAYLAAMGAIGLLVSSRRLGALLLR
jgi:lipooligosaccharide transport system permease protein